MDRPNPARARLEAMRALRRAASRQLNASSGLSGGGVRMRFDDARQLFLTEGPDAETVSASIADAVQTLIKFGGVTEESVGQAEGRALWDSHLDPMYNMLRDCISKSIGHKNREQEVEFWRTVGHELQKQLSEIAMRGAFKPSRLGDPPAIVRSELMRH